MKTTLKTWTHPKTGKKRVYINMPGLRAKVWITYFEPYPGHASTQIHHREEDRYDYPNELYCEQGIRQWDAVYIKAMEEVGLDDNASWKDILNFAK